MSHIPVLLNEVIENLNPQDGEVYVDGTFGAGGYTKAILDKANCCVYAIDRDPNVRKIADELIEIYGKDRLKFVPGEFGNMQELLLAEGIKKVDGIVLDLGVSSMQLDQAERGFSFQKDAALDMRMSQEGVDATHLVNTAEEESLANIIYRYGGESNSRRIAKKIVLSREQSPIETTHQLARIVRSAFFASRKKIDQATKTFQAIRIWVNDELGELERALSAVEKILSPNGRVVIVSFHSLEDQIIKQFMNLKSGKTKGQSRHVISIEKDIPKGEFDLLTKKAVKPSNDEVASNPRSRSAKLRAAVRRQND